MRIKYTIICLLASLGIANAQFQNYVLQTPDNTSNTYIGRDYVRLLPGYSFSAASGKTMNAKISSALTTADANTFLSAASPNGNPDALTTINTSLAVGQIPISSSVSPTGAKCYNVPIDIVPGRQGFQPNISLSYNSQAGNGLLGMGWNISGLSSIERVNKNMFYDGKNDIVNLKDSDAFTLDGIRLINLGGRPTGAVQYFTVQGNVNVTAYYSYLNNTFYIQYFKVQYPNGSVGIFGFENTTSSKLSYPITKLTDLNGNTITFSYTLDVLDLQNTATNEVYYIDEINYGKCSDKDNFAKIKFTYEDRSDQIFSLQSTKSCVYRKRLSKIESFANPTLVRTYQLSYSNTDPRIASNQNDVSHLTQIGCSANSESLNPLKFYYGESGTTSLAATNQSTTLGSSNFDLRKIKMLRGKFDSNIQNDALLVYPDSAMYQNGSIQYTFSLAYPSSEQIKVYQNLNNAQSDPTTIAVESGFLGALCANIDGVGSDEVIKINSAGISQNAETIKFKIYKPGTSPGLVFYRELDYLFQVGFPISDYGHPTTVIPKEFYSGDFSGKGKTEILCIPKRNLFSTKVTILDLENEKPVFSGNLFTRADNDLVFAIDIDGDGQTELVHVTNAQTDLYKYNQTNGLVNIGKWALTTADFISQTTVKNVSIDDKDVYSRSSTAINEAFFADINGDGKIDIIKAPARIKRHYKYIGVNVRTFYCRKCGALYCGLISCPECGDREWTGEYNAYCIYNGPDHVTAENHSYFMRIGNLNKYKCTKNIMGDCAIHGCFVPMEYDWNLETHNDWICYFTNGTSMPVKKTFTGPSCSGDSKIFIQDTDGDNVPELIVDGKLYAYRDKDHIFDATPFFSTNPSDGSVIIPFDINSDKSYNQLIALNSNGIEKVLFSQNRAKNNLVSLMINSLGVVDKTNYDQLYQGINYTPGTQATFPNSDFVGPIWVSTQNSTMYNKELLSTTTYSYAGAILHKQGLGLRGFTSLKVKDMMTNKITTTTFDPYKMGVVIGQSLDNAESSFKYNFTDYDSSTGGNKKIKLLLTDKTVTDKLKGNTVTTTYPIANYDSYGNPGKEITDFGEGITSTIENTYGVSSSRVVYLIGLLTNRKTTLVRGGKSFNQTEGYEYDANNRLHYARKYIGSKMLTETEYKYYPTYGTVSSETVHNIPTNDDLTTSYTYDDDQCSLKTKTDPQGLVTTYINDLSNRLLTGVTDYLGNKVTYNYDYWRRKNYELRPDGTTTNTTWNWNTSDINRLIYKTQTSTGQPATTLYTDALGRETRKAIVGFDGTPVLADKAYDNFGRLASTSAPYKSGSAPLTTYAYDEYDRITTVVQPSGSTTSYGYSGNSVTENKDGVSVTKTTDVTGKLVSSQDAGGTVTYAYRPDGQPDNVNAAGVVTSFEYVDDYNRQTKLIDPSAGTVGTVYDDANHTVTQTWNSGKQIKIVSNKFGQALTKTTPDFTTTYGYDTSGRSTGSTSTNGTAKRLTYDSFGRLVSMTETVSGKTYQEVYGYDQGRINNITYNTNTGNNTLSYPVTYKYNGNGYLYRLEDGSGNRLREVNSVDAMGHEVSELLGNGLTTTKNYTPEGLWTNVTTSNNIQNMSFDFNRVTGTLNSRTDNAHGLSESFTYDGLYRLKNYGSKAMDYNVNGNIASKTDVGGYSYADASKPYTLSTVTNAAADLTSQLNVDYTVMSRPTSIRNTTSLTATFNYNDAYDRSYMQILQGSSETLSKYYLGAGRYEIETAGGVEKQRLYLNGSPYTASILLEKVGGAATQTYYLHRDYLGSITQITDNSANLAAEYSYDAWGRMRNPANWQVYAQGSQPAMIYGGRGYTGHEHLNQFGLINMNARLYDPLLARFLAPDPFVNSGMTNDFNRYVYCRDNPMMYTDPSGKSLWSWLKRNVVDPFSREWNHVFGNGFTVGFGTNTQFSSANAVIAPNGANGTPYGPGVGIQTNNWKTVSPVYANYQDGFFNTQSVNLESNLQTTVMKAEQNAKDEYNYDLSLQRFSNQSSYLDVASVGFEINQLALKAYIPYVSEFSEYAGLYRNLGNAGRMFGTIGNAAGIASLWIDYNSVRKGDISKSRYGYHATSFGISVAIGAAAGGITGAAAGGLFWGGEVLYDHMVVPAMDWYWQLENGLRTFPQRFNFPY